MWRRIDVKGARPRHDQQGPELPQLELNPKEMQEEESERRIREGGEERERERMMKTEREEG